LDLIAALAGEDRVDARTWVVFPEKLGAVLCIDEDPPHVAVAAIEAGTIDGDLRAVARQQVPTPFLFWGVL